jgi:large conductance mechanosensitive channel
MGMMQEFKEFAVKGNVVDMAVGVIIGGAFGKIVSSFVGDVVMPLIGLAVGGVDFTKLSITLKEAVDEKTPAVLLNYGNFIQTVFDFTIVAFAIFMAIRMMNKMKKEAPPAPETPLEPSKEQVLLSEIRDLLKSKN